MAAARAGGIIANSSNQRDFFDNIEIQNSLLKLAQKKNQKNYLFGHFMYLSKIF